MNLFISNFKSEARTLAAVAACLLASETAVRILLPHISTDWQNYQAIARLASSVPPAQDRRVLLLGNSLTKRGIDAGVLQAKLEAATGARLSIEKIATDDSTITEWLYFSRGALTNPNSRPNLLVVGYAEDQLSDRAPVHVDRLAGYYGGLRIARELFQEEVHDFGSRTDFVLSSMSAVYANRDRIRTQFLDRLIPGFRDYAQQANHAAKISGTARTVPQYQRLKRLLALCRDNSVTVAVVAMPIPYEYRIDREVETLAGEYGAAFFNMTHVPQLSGAHYSDGYHLNEGGTHIYSEAFATTLIQNAQVLSRALENKPRSLAGLW